METPFFQILLSIFLGWLEKRGRVEYIYVIRDDTVILKEIINVLDD